MIILAKCLSAKDLTAVIRFVGSVGTRGCGRGMEIGEESRFRLGPVVRGGHRKAAFLRILENVVTASRFPASCFNGPVTA